MILISWGAADKHQLTKAGNNMNITMMLAIIANMLE